MYKLIGTISILLMLLGCSEITRNTRKSSEISVSKNFDFNKYKRITVLPFNTTKPERYNFSISDRLSTSLMKFDYIVVERMQLETVLKELKLEISGLTQNDMKRLGKFLNIDAVIIGSLEYEPEGNDYWWLRSATMRMVDISTGELVISVYSNAYNKDIDFVADDIITLMKRENYKPSN